MKLKLPDVIRTELRTRHYSLRTEKVYISWVRKFIFYNHKQHPPGLGTTEIASLLYSSGLRINECLRLRIKDIDFDYKQRIIRDGKGEKNRRTTLPESLIDSLKKQIQKVKEIHNDDLKRGLGKAPLPYSLSQKYPNAGKEFGWQFIPIWYKKMLLKEKSENSVG